tara:strand:- start:177 stop:458 length:282 start_codon:yes stop_codon:yes gene_type:complete
MPKEDSKFTKEELEQVKEIQQRYIDVQHKIGQLGVAKIRLEQQSNAIIEQENTLTKSFSKIQTDEKDFISAITEKYGDGVLDPKTGVYNKNQK